MKTFMVLILTIFGLILPDNQVFADGDGITEAAQSGHRHRHHRTSSPAAPESEEFVAAYRVTEAPPQQNDENNDEVESEGGSTSNSLETRLNTLEQDVRHLCLEDEEDVDRRVRYLGVTCKCPKTEAPVCGSDNVTYFNRCYLHCRAQQAEMGYHRYKITLKKFGRC